MIFPFYYLTITIVLSYYLTINLTILLSYYLTILLSLTIILSYYGFTTGLGFRVYDWVRVLTGLGFSV